MLLLPHVMSIKDAVPQTEEEIVGDYRGNYSISRLSLMRHCRERIKTSDRVKGIKRKIVKGRARKRKHFEYM